MIIIFINAIALWTKHLINVFHYCMKIVKCTRQSKATVECSVTKILDHARVILKFNKKSRSIHVKFLSNSCPIPYNRHMHS